MTQVVFVSVQFISDVELIKQSTNSVFHKFHTLGGVGLFYDLGMERAAG